MVRTGMGHRPVSNLIRYPVSAPYLARGSRSGPIIPGLSNQRVSNRPAGGSRRRYQRLSHQLDQDVPSLQPTTQRKKNCILIPSKNSEKLAEVILYLKNNEAKRKEVAESGHYLYLERFSMRQTSETIVKLLNELTNKKID